MKDLLKILLGFLPWILFGIMAGPPLTRLEMALAIALATTLALGVKQLRKGFFLSWGSLLFFLVSFILVAFLKNLWVVENMDLLARGSLAVIAWGSIIAGQPFSLQYARESVPEAYWHTPEFIRTGYFISICLGNHLSYSPGSKSVQAISGPDDRLALSPARYREHVLRNHLYPMVRA
jgi:carotenoid cleavage dioxygenase